MLIGAIVIFILLGIQNLNTGKKRKKQISGSCSQKMLSQKLTIAACSFHLESLLILLINRHLFYKQISCPAYSPLNTMKQKHFIIILKFLFSCIIKFQSTTLRTLWIFKWKVKKRGKKREKTKQTNFLPFTIWICHNIRFLEQTVLIRNIQFFYWIQKNGTGWMFHIFL